jgi:hypothetical protein
MASFHWKGRGPDGQEIEGELVASSKEQAVQLLRARRILVTTMTPSSTETAGLVFSSVEAVGARAPEPRSLADVVRQGATQPSHPFQGLLISGAFLLAALVLGSLAPIVVCECERVPDGRVDCLLKERVLWVVSLRQQSLTGVTSVTTEVTRSFETRGTSRRSTTESRLVLSDSLGNSIRPQAWEGSSAFGASASTMRDAVAALIRDPAPGRISLWEGHWVPLLLAGLCLLIAALMFVATVLSMFRRSRAWVYERVESLAVDADRRRKQSKTD